MFEGEDSLSINERIAELEPQMRAAQRTDIIGAGLVVAPLVVSRILELGLINAHPGFSFETAPTLEAIAMGAILATNLLPVVAIGNLFRRGLVDQTSSAYRYRLNSLRSALNSTPSNL